MAYLRIELYNNEQYMIEVYRESMLIISNTDIHSLYRKIIELAGHFIKDLKMPRSRLIGYT